MFIGVIQNTLGEDWEPEDVKYLADSLDEIHSEY